MSLPMYYPKQWHSLTEIWLLSLTCEEQLSTEISEVVSLFLRVVVKLSEVKTSTVLLPILSLPCHCSINTIINSVHLTPGASDFAF